MSSPFITVIVVFEVPIESVEQFLSDWRSDRNFMIHQPGFVDGTLHHSVQPDVRFRFVNIARWESEEAWKAALETGEERRAEQGIDRLGDWTAIGIKVNAAAYRDELHY